MLHLIFGCGGDLNPRPLGYEPVTKHSTEGNSKQQSLIFPEISEAGGNPRPPETTTECLQSVFAFGYRHPARSQMPSNVFQSLESRRPSSASPQRSDLGSAGIYLEKMNCYNPLQYCLTNAAREHSFSRTPSGARKMSIISRPPESRQSHVGKSVPCASASVR